MLIQRSAYLTDGQAKRIEEFAAGTHRTASETLRRAVEFGLNHMDEIRADADFYADEIAVDGECYYHTFRVDFADTGVSVSLWCDYKNVWSPTVHACAVFDTATRKRRDDLRDEYAVGEQFPIAGIDRRDHDERTRNQRGIAAYKRGLKKRSIRRRMEERLAS